MAEKRYLCIGGLLRKAARLRPIWVSSHRLPDLYGVDPEECVYALPGEDEKSFPASLIRLHPDPHGHYALPGLPGRKKG